MQASDRKLYIIISACALGVLTLAVLLWWMMRKMSPFFISHKRTKFTWRIHKGRKAAQGHSNMGVFLIGMRINKWHRMDLWIPTLFAMSEMLRELQQNDVSLGYYGGETYGMLALLLGYPSLQVTYWESIDKILEYSSGKTHRKKMRAYMQAMNKAKGAVGVWHEMYEVSRVEGMHRDMPEFGLVRAIGSLPADGELDRAQNRINKCPFNVVELSAKLAAPMPAECPFQHDRTSATI